ncbi:MAG: alpha-L-rhamnosidase [Verrucomicrobia bacterium]|nr:MAG: alpha-L-rhamnosidase [Verrucomicrobiota bacterium]TAE87123.1 MAG: alpha-L-rhamnosidase [Verrucomicrobiota bacterium]TAF24927.1 MAG: alpha-L-rhamnosidase [Verrucomicrobiota bacterium]TAF40746.1 MAG: alpha-L-rhamnosidase [Verrucomicrobiota bacterium]
MSAVSHTRRFAAVWLAFSLAAEGMEAPSGLLCNLLVQPEKSLITEPRPDFGWIVPASRQGDRQRAWQILVASSESLIVAGKGDLWNSGKVESNRSINVAYDGAPLAPQRAYWWRVRTWGVDGKPSPFSEPQKFVTGEFGRSNKKWPGESRWVPLPDEQGWTFENRPPVVFQANPAAAVVARPDGSWFLDFGKAAFATLSMSIDWKPSVAGTASYVVQVALGEKRKGDAVDSKPGGGIIHTRVPLTIRPGKHDYTLQLPRFVPRYPHSQAMPAIMPDVIPFRYAEVISGAEKIVVNEPKQLALWIGFDDSASFFTSSEPALNDVYQLCRYSVKVNTFNGDYAASQRERMMYEADSYIHQLSHYAVDRSFATARYSMENMIFHASWPTEWISHSIMMAWADYWHTGNPRSLGRYYEQLKPKAMLALAGEDGLISTRGGKQTKEFRQSIHFNGAALKDIVDWPQSEADGFEFREVNTVVNAFHYRSLVDLASIAAVLGKDKEASFYRERAARVKSAIHERMFDPARGIYVDGVGAKHASLHANLFPLAFGVVPKQHRKTVVDFIKSRGMACSVYPTVYLLEALFDAGEERAAIDLMTATHDRSWLHMIRVGSTVTTEAWDVKYKANSGWTHAWSSAPAQILPRKLVGIESMEAGFGRVRIHPRPGDVAHARARLPTIRGMIDAGFQRGADGSFELSVSLPANVVGEAVLPCLDNASDELLLNGRAVRGRRVENRGLVVELGSGRHRILRKPGSK